MKIYEVAEILPPDVAAAFDQLGELQRGAPEIIMVKAQRVLGGGVLNNAIEHVGDITNRMTRQGGLMDWGLGEAATKIARCYRSLSHPYGFEREFEENLKANIAIRGISEASYRRGVDAVLRQYAEAHEQLPVYNYAQWAAREAAACLGRRAFTTAESHLNSLFQMSKDFATWKQRALEFRRDESENLLRYPYPRKYLKINQPQG